jgi:hypothetical protein
LINGRLVKCPSCDFPWANETTGNISAFIAFKKAFENLALAMGNNNPEFSGFSLTLEAASDPFSGDPD